MSATYDATAPTSLTDVENTSNVPVGALVETSDDGPEIYVVMRDISARRLTLSGRLGETSGVRTITFRRLKYLLDSTDVEELVDLTLSGITLRCGQQANGVILAASGRGFRMKDCVIAEPKARGITSPGSGCAGMVRDRTDIVNHTGTARDVTGFNVNGDGARVQNCTGIGVQPWGVFHGTRVMLTGNRVALCEGAGRVRPGLILTRPDASGVVQGNSFENCTVKCAQGEELQSSPPLIDSGNLVLASQDDSSPKEAHPIKNRAKDRS